MKYQVTKIFTFDSGHRLSNYDGKCKHIHGHTYICEITVESKTLNETGMVIDFTYLKEIFKQTIDTKFDHKLLLYEYDKNNQNLSHVIKSEDNSIVWLNYNPTAENIAKDIFDTIKGCLPKIRDLKLAKVKLYETPTSYAEVSENEAPE